MKKNVHILRNMRFKRSVFDMINRQAQDENRSFNNMVETILMNHLTSKGNESKRFDRTIE